MLSCIRLAALFLLLGLVSLSVLAEDDPTFKNVVYLIQNAETKTKNAGSGLSPNGTERADCLVDVCAALAQLGLHNILTHRAQVFGPSTNMAVGFIIAEPPTKKSNDSEAVDTVTPLAVALGIPVNTSW